MRALYTLYKCWVAVLVLLGVVSFAAPFVYAKQVQHDEHTAHNNDAPSHAPTPAFNAEQAYTVSQQAIGRRLSNHPFTNTSGAPVRLYDFLGQPVVISMIYTSCHHICPTLTKHLSSVVDIGRDALGEEAFTVLTIGFDTVADTPQQMAMFAAQRGVDEPFWHFMSADEQTVSVLSGELGFLYQSSPRGFDHITQTTVVDANGTIRNQVYGVNFDAPLLVEALKHLLRGQVFQADTVEGWWREIKLLCTVYDPATGRYHFDYSLIIALIMGLACLSAVGVFIFRAWRSSRQLGATP